MKQLQFIYNAIYTNIHKCTFRYSTLKRLAILSFLRGNIPTYCSNPFNRGWGKLVAN